MNAQSERQSSERHSWACICRGAGTIEDGPAGATYSVPCPGPPDTIQQWGRTYVRADIKAAEEGKR